MAFGWKHFFPLQGADALASKRIRGIIPYKKGVLVVTAYNGLYYCDGRTMEPFLTGAEEFMRENEVFCVAKRMIRLPWEPFIKDWYWWIAAPCN